MRGANYPGPIAHDEGRPPHPELSAALHGRLLLRRPVSAGPNRLTIQK